VFTSNIGSTSLTITLTGGIFAPQTARTNHVDYFSITTPGTGGFPNPLVPATATVTRTSDTEVNITGLTATTAAGSGQKLTVAGAALASQPTAVTVRTGEITSAAFTLTAAHNSVTITLTGGTYKAGAITAADFTFAGTNASALATGTAFTRVNDTQVVITGISGLTGKDNAVTVLGATQATAATGVACAGVTLTDVPVSTPDATTTSGHTKVTITLTGGIFKSGIISPPDFDIHGTDSGFIVAGTFTRTSDTVVTISGLSLTGGTDVNVEVKATALATQAASAAIASAP
jgi:hypothetical protein